MGGDCAKGGGASAGTGAELYPCDGRTISRRTRRYSELCELPRANGAPGAETQEGYLAAVLGLPKLPTMSADGEASVAHGRMSGSAAGAPCHLALVVCPFN